jgi:hypothetical protein
MRETCKINDFRFFLLERVVKMNTFLLILNKWVYLSSNFWLCQKYLIISNLVAKRFNISI